MDAVPRELDREELELRAFKAAQINDALAELAKTDGWKTLIEIFGAAREQYYATLSRSLMRGKEIEQRKLDYNRGKFDGVQELLQQPARARDHLERALRRLEAAPEDEKE